MFQLNSRKKKEAFLYRFALECLGRTLEVGLSYEELENWKARSARLLSLPKGWDKSLNSLRGKLAWRKHRAAPSNHESHSASETRKKRRTEAREEATAAT